MHDPARLFSAARADGDTVLGILETRSGGLDVIEATVRLKQFGANEIAREKRQSALARLLGNLSSPLVLLLLALGAFYAGALGLETAAGTNLIWVALGIFVVAWIGQFVGHYVERARPSFFKDLQFLLIGPLWEMAHLYEALGIPQEGAARAAPAS